MRRALHLLVFGAIFLAVRSCGVNQTYDRLKYGADSVSDSVGVPAAGRALREQVVPAVANAASRSVQQSGAATLDGAERVVAEDVGLRAQLRKAAQAIERGFFDLVGRPEPAPPSKDDTPPEERPSEGRGGAAR